MNWQPVLAIAIFLLTLTLVIWQPRGLGIGFSAIGGALLALATGVVTPANIPEVWGIVWNATFTLVALIILSMVMDEAGFFQWIALRVARWGHGNGHFLFALLILLGAVVTALFTNDGTALILTLIVMEMVLALGFSQRAILAFVMAIGFIADATSLPLTVSNLTNIIVADYFQLGFSEYARVMVPVNFVAIAASLGTLWIYFRHHIPTTYNLSHLPAPAIAICDPIVFRWSFAVPPLLLVGYFFAEPLGIPVCVIVGLAALGLLALARRTRIISVSKILRQAPWQVVLFSLGMYLVVIGLRNVGLTALLSQLLEEFATHGLGIAAIGTGFLATLLSAAMNNLPTVLIDSLAIREATGICTDATCNLSIVREATIYANVIGCDLGPKITPIGSLSTLLWLHILARKGLFISWGQYCRIGLVLTLPVLVLTLLSLIVWLPWVFIL